MIAQVMARWMKLKRELHGRQIAVVLDTSCLNFETQTLRQVCAMGFELLLPDNVYWELRLLTQSRMHFSQRAREITERFDGAHRVSWDLEQLYAPAFGGISRSALYDGILVFLFGDMNKQDEFLQQVCPMRDSYILLHTDWDGNESPVVCDLNHLRGCSYRQAIYLPAPLPGPEFASLSGLYVVDAYGNCVMSGADFRKTGESGRYSQIYTHSTYPDRLFKVYRQCVYTGHNRDKLVAMERFIRNHPISCAAFPESLLLTYQMEVLGYAMPAFRGDTLYCYCDNGWAEVTPVQKSKIILNLMLHLLELNIHGILVNDLSNNNILVSRDAQVFFVDCDSFQFRNYPGGPITEIYCHREIDPHRADEKLHMPRHEYFSLAVLLFQCFLLDDPLFGETAKWCEDRFPLNKYGGSDVPVNAVLLENWKQLDPKLRSMFCDSFSFRRDFSIGAWLRALEYKG